MKLRAKHQITAAFTLVEVVLAIAISVGIMFVALYFYSQCSNLRTQLIDESEKIGTMRLLLQKMASDLRSAQAHPQFSFNGASNSIEFIKSGALPLSSWSVVSNAAIQYPSSLARVNYQLVTALNGTNLMSLGVSRHEQPLNRLSNPGDGVQIGQTEVATNDLNSLTNDLSSVATNEFGSTNVIGLLTDKIHTLQFRYWDGAVWTNVWGGTTPPSGVEITLAADAIDPYDSNAEMFRRVVFLPSGAKPSPQSAESSTLTAKN
jgi:type II secretory pathway component PulJ